MDSIAKYEYLLDETLLKYPLQTRPKFGVQQQNFFWPSGENGQTHKKRNAHFWPCNRLSGFWFHCLVIHQAYCQFIRIVRHFRLNKMNREEVRRSKKAWCNFRLLIVMWWVSRGVVINEKYAMPHFSGSIAVLIDQLLRKGKWFNVNTIYMVISFEIQETTV